MRAALDRLFTPGAWPWVAALFAVSLLAAAHGFERIGGYAPCALCLRQREVLWAVLALAVVAIVVRRLLRTRARERLFVLGLAVLLAGSVAVAGFHVGVEQKWWPGPTECSGPAATPLAVEDLAAVLSGQRAVRPPACDEPNWWFLGLTMASWNALLSAAMAGASLFVALERRR